MLDMSVLNVLRAAIKDKFPGIIELFISNGGTLMAALKTAVREENAAEMRRTAHALKSTIGQMGAVRISPLIIDIERLAGEDNSLAAEKIIRAAEEWERVIQALRSLPPA